MLRRLGDIPLARIRMIPPGTATEQDAILVCELGTPCELIDGILVDKAMGYFESIVELELSYFLRRYLGKNDIGFLLGPAAPQRPADQVRIPDLSLEPFSSPQAAAGRRARDGAGPGRGDSLAGNHATGDGAEAIGVLRRWDAARLGH
jgi:hypothetical protein